MLKLSRFVLNLMPTEILVMQRLLKRHLLPDRSVCGSIDIPITTPVRSVVYFSPNASL